MIIRRIEPSDAEEFLELNRRIDESGFMLHEPGERDTTVTQQIKRINDDDRSVFLWPGLISGS